MGERTEMELLRLLAALIVVNAVLLTPWWVLQRGLTPPWLALEAGVIVGAFALVRPTPGARRAALAVAAVVTGLAVVGLADAVMRTSLGRPLNLYLDLWLLDSVGHLLSWTFGWWTALGLAFLVLTTTVGATLVVARLLTPTGAGSSPAVAAPALPRRMGSVALVAFVSLGLTADRLPVSAQHVDWLAVRLVREQAVRWVETRAERARFAEALAMFPGSYGETPDLLSGLGGRDVVLAFVESYGMTALEDPRYRAVVGPRLDDLEERLAAAGLHLATGRLVAPSQGGQSWFGHGSMLSGLWLDNQLRYDMLLASERETLVDDFRRAGYRTVAVMPAIQMPWPEGRRLGYDEIYTRPDIDYAGPALNWVTMPDQFTWSFLERAIRAREPARPLFAELGLISSHAPWTPILPVLEDWSAIGDGAVFAEWADAGEAPAELWRDTERVREHYARSVEYAVHTVGAYAERFVDERTLLVVLGDHQPAPLITGEEVPWDVPVHVISGSRDLVEPFLAWGFEEGAWPAPDPKREALGVDYFRDWFVRAFSGE